MNIKQTYEQNIEWRYHLSTALNMTCILSFYTLNKWNKSLDSALSEHHRRHSSVKENAFPKDSSLHLDAVGAPLSSLDSHLFTLAPGWAMFPWRYKIKDDHVARLTRGPDPKSVVPARCHRSAWSYFARTFLILNRNKSLFRTHIQLHLNTLLQLSQKPTTIRNLQSDRVLQTTWLCKIDDRHPKFCTLVGKMLYTSV